MRLGEVRGKLPLPMNANKFMLNRKYIITISMLAIIGCAAFLLYSKNGNSVHCISSERCIEVSSGWKSVKAMQGSRSLVLVKNNADTMDIYFLNADDLTPKNSELIIQSNHPWGTATKISPNSPLYDRFNKAGFLVNRLYLPRWNVFVACDRPTCLDDIKGFSMR